MLKRLSRCLIRLLGIGGGGIEGIGVSPWESYKSHIKCHPQAILDPVASIKIFNQPTPSDICLEIGEGSHIFASFHFLRPQSRIKIGRNCQIGNVNFICADAIEVQDDAIMAWGITIMDTDSHPLSWEDRKNDVTQCYADYLVDKNNFIKNKDWSHVQMKKITIGKKSWIGFNAAILKGVTIGEGAIVAACTVVTKDVPPYTVVAGNPARVVKHLKAEGEG